jgi:lipoic acid synthetase
LKHIASSDIPAKSGLMLGLGETHEEILQTLEDLRTVDCRLLSIGQYLQPSRNNIPVSAYISPQSFQQYRNLALSMGFSHVESGPLVRSSYHSIDFLNK